MCSLDVAQRNRSQPFATVRNRSQPLATVRKCPCEVAMAMPMGSAAKVSLLNLVSRGRHGTL